MSSRGSCVEKETPHMTSPKQSVSWQEMRRLLASKSKIELLHLIRDLYLLTTDNKDFVHAQVLTPKPKAPKSRQPKKRPTETLILSSKTRRASFTRTPWCRPIRSRP